METASDELLFSNFTYNPDWYYFLYVGDLKITASTISSRRPWSDG